MLAEAIAADQSPTVGVPGQLLGCQCAQHATLAVEVMGQFNQLRRVEGLTTALISRRSNVAEPVR